MNSLRSNLSRMLMFTKVAQTGSFSAAARQLSITRSVVSEAISALEDELGCRLLHRSTRALRLTRAGEAFLARSSRMVDEAEAAVRAVARSQERPTGVLRVTAPRVIAEYLLVPVIAKLAHEHGLQTDLRVDDRRLDLLDEGFDASVRVGRPHKAGHVIRKLGNMDRALVAVPALAEQAKSPGDLNALAWVVHDAVSRRFTLRGPGCERTQIHMRAAVAVNDTGAFRALVCAGVGLGLIPSVVVRDDLAAGTLIRVLPAHNAGTSQIFVSLASRKHLPLRTRLLIDGLKEHIAGVAM